MSKIVEDDRARQARPGRPVLYVLVGSLILLGFYMIAMMTWSGSTAPSNPAQTQSQQTSNPTSSGNSSAMPAGNPAYPSPSAPPAGTPGSAPNR